MLEITTAIFLTLMASALYHLIPPARLRLRIAFVACFSFLVVFAYYPLAALCASGAGIFAWVLHLLGRYHPALQKYGPFSLIGLLVLFSYEDFLVNTDVYGKTLVQFGMSFYLLRLYLALRTAAARRQSVGLDEYLAIALFFPIFPAGPICAQEAFTGSAALDRPLLHNYLLGFLRIGMGIFALYFVTGFIEALNGHLVLRSNGMIDWVEMGPLAAYLAMMLNFLDLYANFAGYTNIAIGLGLFFGFQIPENFKYPFLATNIQNFWQRWHLSLSRFITAHIYLPLMLTLRKPRLCMILAFIMVGMWHKVNLQYLVWGTGHGMMLVAYMTYSRSSLRARAIAGINPRLSTGVAWLLTMSLVSFLSTFANQTNLNESLALTRSLVPGW